MTRHRIVLALLAALLLGALSACGSGAPKVDWDVQITGAVSKPLTLSYADLARRNQVDLQDVVMRRSQGEDTTNDWRGPALDAILADAGASANAKAVVLVAADGYSKEVPMADLTDAIIALQQDGEWIANDEESGPLRIVVPSLPANAWLYQITEIQVVE